MKITKLFLLFLMAMAIVLINSGELRCQEQEKEVGVSSETPSPNIPQEVGLTSDSGTTVPEEKRIRGEDGIDYFILTNLSKEEGYIGIAANFTKEYKAIPGYLEYKKNTPPLVMCDINKWKSENGRPSLYKHKETEINYWIWDADRPFDPETYYMVCFLINTGQYLPSTAVEHGSANMKDIKTYVDPQGNEHYNYNLKPRTFKGEFEDLFELIK